MVESVRITPAGRGTAALMTGALAAVAVTLAACGGAASAPQTAAFTTSSNTAATDSDLVDHSPGLVVPVSVHIPAGVDPTQARAVVRTAQQLYTFWNTGDAAFLDEALAPDFQDDTLPPGRPQGPAGPRAASAAFRAAVPDLSCQLADLVTIAGST
jgi:hypothetical protein